MNERKVTTTIEVTKIYRDVPECFELNKSAIGDMQKEIIKRELDADNVNMVKVQEFQLQGLRDQMNSEGN